MNKLHLQEITWSQLKFSLRKGQNLTLSYTNQDITIHRLTSDHLLYLGELWLWATINYCLMCNQCIFPHLLPWIPCSSLGRFPASAMKQSLYLWYVSCQSETQTSCGAWDCKTCSCRIGLDCFVSPVSRSLIEVCDQCNTMLVCVCVRESQCGLYVHLLKFKYMWG